MRRAIILKLLLTALIVVLNETHYVDAQSENYNLSEVMRIGIGTANSIAWSPNADIIAVGGTDNVRLYNSALEEITYFAEQPKNVWRIAWSPDGTKIASQVVGIEIQIRDAETGNVLITLTQPGAVDAIAWSPDSQNLAVSSGISFDWQIIIWNVPSGNQVQAFENQDKLANLDWSPDGTKIAAASRDDTVLVWDVTTGELLVNLDHHNVFAVAWSPDGGRLATGATGRPALIVWNTDTYEPIYMSELSYYVEAIAWKPDSTLLAINSTNGEILVLEAATGELIQNIASEADIVHSLSWNLDGSKLALLTRDYLLRIWDFDTSQFSATFTGYSDLGLAVDIDWRPNSEQIAGVFKNLPRIEIFDATTGLLVNELPIPLEPLSIAYNQIVSWSPDGRRVMCECGLGDRIFIWNAENASPATTIIGQDDSIYSPSWSPDSLRIAAVKAENGSTQLLIWDAITGELLSSVTTSIFGSFIWSADSSSIVFRNDEGQWQIWDPSHQIVAGLPTSDLLRGPIVSEPGSNRVVRAECDDRECQLWALELLSGELTQLATGEDDFINTLDWSTDGNLLAGSGVFTLHIWDTQSWTLAAEAHFSDLENPITWSSDNRRIAVISGGVVRILRLELAS